MKIARVLLGGIVGAALGAALQCAEAAETNVADIKNVTLPDRKRRSWWRRGSVTTRSNRTDWPGQHPSIPSGFPTIGACCWG